MRIPAGGPVRIPAGDLVVTSGGRPALPAPGAASASSARSAVARPAPETRSARSIAGRACSGTLPRASCKTRRWICVPRSTASRARARPTARGAFRTSASSRAVRSLAARTSPSARSRSNRASGAACSSASSSACSAATDDSPKTVRARSTSWESAGVATKTSALNITPASKPVQSDHWRLQIDHPVFMWHSLAQGFSILLRVLSGGPGTKHTSRQCRLVAGGKRATVSGRPARPGPPTVSILGGLQSDSASRASWHDFVAGVTRRSVARLGSVLDNRAQGGRFLTIVIIGYEARAEFRAPFLITLVALPRHRFSVGRGVGGPSLFGLFLASFGAADCSGVRTS